LLAFARLSTWMDCGITTGSVNSRSLGEIFDINRDRPLQRGEAPEAYSW
jgi:hypothetical protein